MYVRVRVFGALREALGAKELSVDLPEGASARELRARLAERHPHFAGFGPRLRVSVNREFAADDAALAEGDEVAFLPPVSGGAEAAEPAPVSRARCSLSEAPLDADAVGARVAGADAGGLVTFVGAVRERSRGRAIRRLEYEAYPEMALAEMERICDQAAGRWPGARVAIAHRVGSLEVGEVAVVVVAAAPHRAEAFEACRFAIDTLKRNVPIWKKEVASDGAYWVEDHP